MWFMKTRQTTPLLILTVLAATTIALAQTDGDAAAPDQTRPLKDRTQEDYAPFPNPEAGYVTDSAGLLSLDEEERIERWLWQVESRTKVEIIVVTIKSIEDYPGTPVDSIESFARGLFDAYGIGNMPNNDGVLLLVAVGDRNARIELGAGLGHYRDANAGAIMSDTIVPHFRQNDYAGGVTEGVRAIMLEFAGIRAGVNWLLIGLIAAVPIVGLISFSLFRSGKRGWGWICVGFLFVLLLSVSFLKTSSREKRKRSSESWRVRSSPMMARAQ